MADTFPIPVGDLLPQTGPARMLTEVLRMGPDFIEAAGRIPANHPLATGGRAPCFLALELGAQAAAALEALTRAGTTEERSPRIGHLVRIREAEFLVPDFPVDATLRVSARLEGAAPPLARYEIVVRSERVDCLRAVLSTRSGTSAEQSPVDRS